MYEDRVRDVARAVEKDYPDGILSTDVKGIIESKARCFEITEVIRQGGRHAALFINDVRRELQVKINRAPRPEPWWVPRTPKGEKELLRLHNKVLEAVGQSFPDGDPIDIIGPWVNRQGWDIYDVTQKGFLDAAMKKFSGAKSYDHYLEDFWDQFAADNPGNDMGVTKETNPWRTK